MLDFMQDKNQNDAEKGNSLIGPTGINDPAASDQQEYLTPAVGDKTLKQSTMLLAIFIVCGILCLLFMVKKSTPKNASAKQSDDNAQIEAMIEQLTGTGTKTCGQIGEAIKRFYGFADVQQIPATDLKKNPFKHELSAPVEVLSSYRNQNSADSGVTDQELIQNQLERKVQSMQLITIIQAPEGNGCMINDSIVYQGQTIDGFKVSEIGSNYVCLTSDNMTFTLRLNSN